MTTYNTTTDDYINQLHDQLGQIAAKDIMNAVKCVKSTFPYPWDDLCCGNMGSIEFLFEAAKISNKMPLASQTLLEGSESSLNSEASKRLMSVLLAEKQQGDFLFSSGDKRFNLGLFKGVSGIGYTILRRIDANLPNVLLLE